MTPGTAPAPGLRAYAAPGALAAPPAAAPASAPAPAGLTPFGAQVFSAAVQRRRLPRDVFARLQATIARGATLDPDLAGAVAQAMKTGRSSRRRRCTAAEKTSAPKGGRPAGAGTWARRAAGAALRRRPQRPGAGRRRGRFGGSSVLQEGG